MGHTEYDIKNEGKKQERNLDNADKIAADKGINTLNKITSDLYEVIIVGDQYAEFLRQPAVNWNNIKYLDANSNKPFKQRRHYIRFRLNDGFTAADVVFPGTGA